MTLSFSAAKKLMAAVLMGALYAPCIGAETVSSCDDSYVLEFARKYSDHVEYLHYERGTAKLTLYANPQTLAIVVQVIGGLLMSGAGATSLYLASGINEQCRDIDMITRATFGIIGMFEMGFGVYTFLNGLKDYSMKSKKIPYITLDSECLMIWNGERIWWRDVDHIEISSEQETNTTNVQWGNSGISTSHGKTTTTRTLHLIDKYNSDLLLVGEHDCYLPITFDQFRGLVEHYIATYGSRRVQ